MNTIKKFITFDKTKCDYYNNDHILSFLKNPIKTLSVMHCTELAKNEFILFCYIYYLFIKGVYGQRMIQPVINEFFNKRIVEHFLNHEMTKKVSEIVKPFYKEIHLSNFYLKRCYVEKFTQILDKGFYILITIYEFSNIVTKDVISLSQMLLTTENGKHAIILRSHVYNEELKEEVFSFVNSHGTTNMIVEMPYSFLKNNSKYIEAYYINRVKTSNLNILKRKSTSISPLPLPKISK
jgi:hypothetical protein